MINIHPPKKTSTYLQRLLRHTLILSLFLPLCSNALALTPVRFRVMSYNVENYFDCVDDTLKSDEEYLPGGMRGWNMRKYYNKQKNIASVIAAVGDWEIPAVVAFCEVESRQCLLDLTQKSALQAFNYDFIHYESPDFRGIDCALLYDKRQFTPLYNEAIKVQYSDGGRATRDILYVKGLAHKVDTVHLFVCHFSSRWGGTLETESRRVFTAQLVRNRADSIFTINPNANIVIMGDFNDTPSDKSMLHTLAAKSPSEYPHPSMLYNMMLYFEANNQGTHKFHDEWSCLDQFVISENLLDSASVIRTSQSDAHIFMSDFIMEDDAQFLDKKPKRSYVGFKYNGGFSDHLPIYIDLWVMKDE